jgi:putative tricarboxylic transport membrane protein
MARKGELFVGLFFLLVGLGVALESLRYQLGTARAPLPGLFPFLAGLLLIGLSATLLFKATRGEATEGRVLGNLRRPAQLIAGLAIYILIAPLLGYVMATTILSMIILRAMETKSWRVIVLTSLAIAIGTFVIFKPLLGIPLPGGSIFGLD